MPCFRGFHGRVDGLGVAHLADQHDVGVLAQRRAQPGAEIVRIDAISRCVTEQLMSRCRNSIGFSRRWFLRLFLL
jgi:hypothetical protein